MSQEIGERDRASVLQDLESPDEEVRRLAVERLLTLPSSDAIPRLVACLGDAGWRVRKSAVERLVACAESDQVIDALIAALADGENPGRRNAAVEALVGCHEFGVPRLIEALTSEDADVRKFAVDALAGIGSLGARDALIVTLGDSDPNVRAAAADALGVVGGDDVVEALCRTAVDPEEERLVGFSALRALARLEVPMTAADLTPALEDATLRPAAFALLGRVDDEEALSRLLKGLVGGSRATREAAMEALLRLLAILDGARAANVAAQVREAARAADGLVAAATERLETADLAARLVLVQFLGLIGSPECVLPVLRVGRDEALREVAHSVLAQQGDVTESALDAGWPDMDVELRCDACALLGRLPGERSAERLVRALDEDDASLRAAAAQAIGERACAAALPALVRRLETAAQAELLEAEEELSAIIAALVRLAGPEAGEAATENASRAVELMGEKLEGAAEPVRLSIARVLGRIGRAEDAELIVFLLKDPSSSVRRAAVDALSRLDHGTASEPLRLALADESPGVRVAAAAALGGAVGLNAIDDLRRLLHDEDDRVRAAAVRAIGAQCARETRDGGVSEHLALISHAFTDVGVVAMAAAEALTRIASPEAAVAAERLLDRAEPELLQAAIACIGAHGAAETVEGLLRLVSHADWAVRAEAIQALAERRVVKAIPPILRRLEIEQDEFVRDAMLRALKRLEG